MVGMKNSALSTARTSKRGSWGLCEECDRNPVTRKCRMRHGGRGLPDLISVQYSVEIAVLGTGQKVAPLCVRIGENGAFRIL